MTRRAPDQAPPPLFAGSNPEHDPVKKPSSATSYQRGSATSFAGAQAASEKAPGQMAMYESALLSSGPVVAGDFKVVGGLTDLEASIQLGLKRTTICARRGSKRGKRIARDSGHRRDGGSGIKIVVWEHVDYQRGKNA